MSRRFKPKAEGAATKRRWTADEMDAYYAQQRQEYADLRVLNAAHPVRALKDCRKRLVVKNEFIEATAVFEGRRGLWRCVETDPVVGWMKQVPHDRLKVELLKRGMEWRWENFTDGSPNGTGGGVRPDMSGQGAKVGDGNGTQLTGIPAQATA
jgi:hypothetical protein